MQKYLVIFEKTQSGYSAYVPDLPGCISEGKNKEETEKNIYEAIKFHIEGMIEEGLSIPESRSESELIIFPDLLIRSENKKIAKRAIKA
ncbi:MAG: type II toxin-antitoxin system HicB family antitoxin [Oligoflexia bacterium]|nr:type II toxin-antitoxin system HicB family antitoxin [Oligoflexia bacterium]